MPVGWGSSPVINSISGYDISQYVKYFDSHDNELDIRRRAGQWVVVVWGYREIAPFTVKNSPVKDDEGLVRYEDNLVTHIKHLVGAGEPRDNLSEALHSAYLVVRGS
jgi:hypothetical protein